MEQPVCPACGRRCIAERSYTRCDGCGRIFYGTEPISILLPSSPAQFIQMCAEPDEHESDGTTS